MKLLISLIVFITGCSSYKPIVTIKASNKYNNSFIIGYESYEHRKRVVVVDSGVNLETIKKDFMCKDIAMLAPTKSFKYKTDHGMRMTEIIATQMDKSKYCITMVKLILHPIKGILKVEEGIEDAVNLVNTKVVSISLEGNSYSHKEYKAIKHGVNVKGIKFNIAAGNRRIDLDKTCISYPACISKLINKKGYIRVIGAQEYYTNYGSIVDIFMFGQFGGTSAATAYYTGLIVSE